MEIQTEMASGARSLEHLDATLDALEAAPLEMDLDDRVPMLQKKLTVEEFIEIKDHPRQRDTERHLKAALKKHLAKSSPVHQNVSAAVFSGQSYKLDGHTRSLAWERGLLRRPESLKVDVYYCDTFADLLELYTHFDNKFAVETTADTLSGAVRQAGIELTSGTLRRYNFATALQVASRAFGVEETTDPYVNSSEFAEEIKMLDLIDPSAAVFRVGVIAGAIMLLRKHGDKALPFLMALNTNAGVKTTTSSDAVYALSDVIVRTNKGRSGFSRTLELAGKTISCGDRYLKEETYIVSKAGVSVKATKISGYLRGRRAV